MRAKKVDENQKQIVKAFRDMGATVFHLHEVGKGCPDILLGYKGNTILVEIKRDAKATFTAAQIEFMAKWQGSKVIRINNVDEAIALLKNMV